MEVSRDGVGWGARTGDDDVAWLFSLAVAGVLPYLDVGDVGLLHVCGGVALVEHGGDNALPGAIVVGHGRVYPIRVATYIHRSPLCPQVHSSPGISLYHPPFFSQLIYASSPLRILPLFHPVVARRPLFLQWSGRQPHRR